MTLIWRVPWQVQLLILQTILSGVKKVYSSFWSCLNNFSNFILSWYKYTFWELILMARVSDKNMVRIRHQNLFGHWNINDSPWSTQWCWWRTSLKTCIEDNFRMLVTELESWWDLIKVPIIWKPETKTCHQKIRLQHLSPTPVQPFASST